MSYQIMCKVCTLCVIFRGLHPLECYCTLLTMPIHLEPLVHTKFSIVYLYIVYLIVENLGRVGPIIIERLS